MPYPSAYIHAGHMQKIKKSMGVRILRRLSPFRKPCATLGNHLEESHYGPSQVRCSNVAPGPAKAAGPRLLLNVRPQKTTPPQKWMNSRMLALPQV